VLDEVLSDFSDRGSRKFIHFRDPLGKLTLDQGHYVGLSHLENVQASIREGRRKKREETLTFFT
jgi:hypothetical protein